MIGYFTITQMGVKYSLFTLGGVSRSSFLNRLCTHSVLVTRNHHFGLSDLGAFDFDIVG